MTEKDSGPHGVGGWLALLVVVMVVLGPLLGIGRTFGEFASAEQEYPALTQVAEWSSFKTVEWIALLIFCAISIYGGLGLATKCTPDAVSRAKLVLWFNYPISIVVTAMIIPATMIPDSGKEMAMAIPSLLASLIAVAIWTAYLNRSKRVKNTYGLSDESPVAQVPTMAHEVSSTNNLATTGLGQHMSPHPQNGYANKIIPDADYPATVDEDRVYCQIAEELEIGATDKGLWTRLFAKSGGDEKQTKVLYIQERVKRLVAAERLRLEQAAVESASTSARAEVSKLISAYVSGNTLTAEDVARLARASSMDPSISTLHDKIRGKTLLHWCARLGLENEAAILIANGADPNAPDGNGRRAFELTEELALRSVIRSAVDAQPIIPPDAMR